MTWNLALGYIFFFVLAMWFAFSVMNYATHRRFWSRHRFELLQIKVPLAGEVHPAATSHTLSEMGATVELLERISLYWSPFAFEAAIHHVGEEIHFYLYIPRQYKRAIVKDVQTILPGAELISGDYDVWMEGGHIEVAHVRQSKPFMVPLSSAAKPNLDVFSEILRRVSQMKVVGEGMALQWVIRPFSTKRRKECITTIEALRSGAARSFKMLDEGFLATPQSIEILSEKLDSPLFSVNCRILIAHADRNEARRVLREIGEAFGKASNGMLYNELYIAPAKKPQRSIAMFTQRQFDEKEEMVLSAQELASVFHFPIRHAPTFSPRPNSR